MPTSPNQAASRAGATHSQVPAPAHAWDSELFVLVGHDRAHLLTRAKALSAFVEAHPQVALKDLAASLNLVPGEGSCRLAIVATDAAGLLKRLSRARERLADASCQQIKDGIGIYFFQQPLYPGNKLALLFPGEGAQYQNMLADLPDHFPEVRDCLASFDTVTTHCDGKAVPLASVVYVPASASSAQRAYAEQQMRRLGNSIFSVLIADWAMHQLLLQLGLRGDVMGGHSAGELAALSAAGCFDVQVYGLDQLGATLETMQDQEEEASSDSNAILLATGAGRDTVTELMRRVCPAESMSGEGRDVFVAMDNCPHQSVLVGLPGPMRRIEAELQARGIIHERLPFRRPYHTHLFEPFSGPIVRMFDEVQFHLPTTPIYSCTSSRLFPMDVKGIRELALSHWVSPVEFTRMVQSMHDDGVRLFVEVGPRGNLTAFTEDILRNKPALAVASNVQRRSGIAQLNHLAGQLAAQHVPLNLAHFYQRRDPRIIEWESSSRGPRPTAAVFDPSADATGIAPASEARAIQPAEPRAQPAPSSAATAAPRVGAAPATSRRARLLHNYLGLMDKFLETQHSVMQGFLTSPRRTAARTTSPPQRSQRQPTAGPAPGRAAPRFEAQLAPPTPARAVPNTTLVRAVSSAPSVEKSSCLIGKLVHHVPGRELVMRRKLDLAEDLYAGEHTVGGRSVSRVDPAQHGLPVMPMTFSLEMMAQAACVLVPGKVVVGLEQVRLLRWLAFDAWDPTQVELRAKLESAPTVPGAPCRVAMEIQDLGNSTSAPPEGTRWVTSVGTVLLADKYPAAEAPQPFKLTEERPCKISLEALYNNLFHGERFQGVRALDRVGAEGLQARLEVLPRQGLFASRAEPGFLLDPVTIDIAMHPLAAWHLEQPDQAGRILLPFELEQIRFFRPPPAVGTRLISHASLNKSTPRQFTHGVEVFEPGGSVWCRLTNARYWRFYVPFGEVNFHGPKDEYFLSQEFAAAMPHSARGAAHPAESPRACCVKLEPPADLLQPAMRLATAHVTLSPAELDEYRQLAVPGNKIADWLFGRIVAKDAVRILWRERHGERLFPADIEILHDEHGRPLARHRDPARGGEVFPQVSLAHAANAMVALAAWQPRVGIDLEKVEPRDESFARTALDEGERELLARHAARHEEVLTRIWCAKEAVAKALGRGLVAGPRGLAVRDLDLSTGQAAVELGPKMAEFFPDLASRRIAAWTLCHAGRVVASTLCERVEP